MADTKSVGQADAANAWQWLVNGWHALRDKAVSAVTYFTPEREQEAKSQRWGASNRAR